MKKIMLLPFLFCAFFLSSCGDDEGLVEQVTTDLSLKITASYDGEPFQILNDYTLCDGKIIRFDLFDFYLSNIVLLKDNDPQAQVTELSEIDFIDLSKSTLAEATAGHTIDIQNVPVGSYTGIQLGLGVAADLNRTQPEDYGSSHPLRNSDHYWSGWNSYIFSMIGGWADYNEDGEITVGTADSESFAYHNGDDVAYAISVSYKDIKLDENEIAVIHLDLDVSSVFNITNTKFDTDGDSCLDVSDFRGTHSGLSEDDNKEIMADMMSKLAKSITIKP